MSETLTLFETDADFINSFEPMLEGGDPAANEMHDTYYIEEPLGAMVVAKLVKNSFALAA